MRALRRYLAIIVWPSWPIRSETHVSVLPVASAIVTNVARKIVRAGSSTGLATLEELSSCHPDASQIVVTNLVGQALDVRARASSISRAT
ncbi:MAG: hypothetical protein WBY94_25955 [Polyangiaceae bacterium]